MRYASAGRRIILSTRVVYLFVHSFFDTDGFYLGAWRLALGSYLTSGFVGTPRILSKVGTEDWICAGFLVCVGERGFWDASHVSQGKVLIVFSSPHEGEYSFFTSGW